MLKNAYPQKASAVNFYDNGKFSNHACPSTSESFLSLEARDLKLCIQTPQIRHEHGRGVRKQSCLYLLAKPRKSSISQPADKISKILKVTF